MERPLGELRLCAVLIDGTPFKDRQMIVALGIGCDGSKTVLGFREGATENATVVGALLSDLIEFGLYHATAVHPRWRQGAACGGAAARGGGRIHSALPGSQETKRGGPLAGRIQSRRAKKTAERIRDGGLRRRQAGTGAVTSGVDGYESERGAQLGGRNGRDAHCSQIARAGAASSDLVQHERDRVCFLHRGDGLPKREAVASRRS